MSRLDHLGTPALTVSVPARIFHLLHGSIEADSKPEVLLLSESSCNSMFLLFLLLFYLVFCRFDIGSLDTGLAVLKLTL